jgi:beta-N-acetylhexosaminidase
MKPLLVTGLLSLILLAGAADPPAAAHTSPGEANPARADDLLASLTASMTLEQKVAQMFMVTLHGSVMTEVGAAFLERWQPGAVALFGENITTPEGTTALTNDFQQTMLDAGGVPLLIAIDQEGGVVARLTEASGFTVMPAPVLLAAAGPAMAQQAGIAVGQELRAVGINMNLAPVADLETNPDNPIIFRRSFGSEPVVAGAGVTAFAQGLQLMNVLATAKHFPGHGETREDSHGTLPRLDLTRERLDAVELEPFRQAIEGGVAAIMVGHLWLPALDPTPNMPASLSYAVITDLLRGELGFEGLVVTDALDMNAVDMTYNFYDAVVMAVQAGNDLLALGPSIGLPVAEAAMQRVIDEVRAGTISEARIDESVRRILEAKARFGVLDWTRLEPESAPERVNAGAHQALITELFFAGTTIAYDDGGHLPVQPGQRTAVVFLATRYQIQQECSQYADPNSTTWVGVSDNPSSEEVAWAVGAAQDAETVIVFTQDAIRNPDQAALVNALPPEKTVAVALFTPFDWRVYPDVSAYVVTYSSLRPAVPAACAVLFGARPATGTLAVTLEAPTGS